MTVSIRPFWPSLLILFCISVSLEFALPLSVSADQTKLVANDSDELSNFGDSVAISDNTVVVGTHGADAAYVYKKTGSSWTIQQKLTASDAGAYRGWFGSSVAIDEDVVIVGAEQNSGQGAAYIYTQSNSEWGQEIKLVCDSYYTPAYFGRSVDIDGDTAIVGAEGYASSVMDHLYRGAVFIYTRLGSTWELQQMLRAQDTFFSFGRRVAIDGDTAIVYSPGITKDKGAIYIYTRSGGTWSLQQKLTNDDFLDDDHISRSFALEGDTIVISADGDDYNTESAYVYTRTGNLWTLQQRLSPNDTGNAGWDSFATDVAINGDTIIIGEFRYENSTGLAYIFKRSNGTIWTFQNILAASDGSVNDHFGTSVAVDGEAVIIGAYCDDSCKGSAYIFPTDVTPGQVIYDGKDYTSGEVPLDNNNYLTGDTVTVLGNTGPLLKTGYNFAGWNTAVDGSGINYQEGDSLIFQGSSLTLYVDWEKNSQNFPWSLFFPAIFKR